MEDISVADTPCGPTPYRLQRTRYIRVTKVRGVPVVDQNRPPDPLSYVADEDPFAVWDD